MVLTPYFCRPEKKELWLEYVRLQEKNPLTGHSVSHSNIKTKRRFLPNLQTKRFFFAEEDRWVTLKVSTEALRTINKNGLSATVKQLRAQGEKI